MKGVFAAQQKYANCSSAVSTRNLFYVASFLTFVFTLIVFSRLDFSYDESVYGFSNVHAIRTKFKAATKTESTRAVSSDSSSLQDYLRRKLENTKEPWWDTNDAKKTLYVEMLAGTANILQSMASAFTVAFRENINIKIVYWRCCFPPAKWEDLFSFPKVDSIAYYPDGAELLSKTNSCIRSDEIYQWKDQGNKIKWVKDKHSNNEIGCTIACCWREQPFPESVAWFYKSLRPAKDVQEKIDEFKRIHDWDKYQWVGVHVRRNDNFLVMREFMETRIQDELRDKINTTDKETMLPLVNYITLMKQLEQSWPKHKFKDGPFYVMKQIKFFLATDNESVKSEIAKEFQPGLVVWFDTNRMNISMDQPVWKKKLAVVDLYLLSSCDILVGTPFSTFSEAAHLIGGGVYLEPEFAYHNMSAAP
eukprot:g6580.t1